MVKGDNSATDVFGANNATLMNGATYGVGVAGAANSAFSLDGVDDYVNVSDEASLKLSTALTLEAWINPTTLAHAGGYNTIIAKDNTWC